MTIFRLVGSIGLVRKSKAPSLIASTTRSIEPKAVVTIVVTSTRRWETSRISSIPPMPGHPQVGDQDAVVGRAQRGQRLLPTRHRVDAQVIRFQELAKLRREIGIVVDNQHFSAHTNGPLALVSSRESIVHQDAPDTRDVMLDPEQMQYHYE